eukprot:CAMPEP_0197525526 /NCGR_PEP_ID=MMETSP1318-20131121/12853_1 /TAXON_ID=552666 /ORGANISM="Partenskyella glossopodia, Strain RCC365" /LENGTH=275 /DNA_ID=CAMNT_0043079039 /DNA_START=65 /DNA_END=892 /DNA_ORIENTATION=+
MPGELFMVWKHLSRNDMVYLFRVVSKAEQGEFLASKLGLDERYSGPQNELRRKATSELFTNLLGFCHRNQMNAEKASTLISIFYSTHKKSFGPPVAPTMDAFKYFKSLLLKHSVERPPFSIAIFTPADVKVITKYAIETYFRHYKMYQYVFGTSAVLILSSEDDGPETIVEEEPDVMPVGEEDDLIQEQDIKTRAQTEIESQEKSESSKVDMTDVKDDDDKKIEDLSTEEQKKFYEMFKNSHTKMQDDFQKKVNEQQEAFTQKLEGMFKKINNEG